tara:strand:- start:128 stop:463 length:336 start_codon:yes stop_codon:yes gene_type:complete
MGYRSKVIVGVKQDKTNEFDVILSKHNFNPKGSDYLKIEAIDDYKTYSFDYIKWYDSDNWCKEIMDWLDETQFNKLDDCWCVGIGEQGELHSEVGDYWNYVDVIRDIELAH